MPSPVLYSTNPYFAVDIAERYRKGVFFAWVCECFDTSKALPGSAASQIAPSSNPRRIYERLHEECQEEEGHSETIRRLKKTFVRLARNWVAEATITQEQGDEIIAMAKSTSWKI